jgi:hypothetical protein
MIIKENDLRQAIREGLSEARVNHDDMGYFETVIMRFVTDYKLQPLDLKEAKKDLEMCEGVACEDANLVCFLSNWIRRFIEAVNG